MAQIKAREAAALDAADETASRMEDESAMDNLLGDLEVAPEIPPGAAEPPPAEPKRETPPADVPKEKSPITEPKKEDGKPPGSTETDEEKAKREDEALEAEIDEQIKDLPPLPHNAPEYAKKAMKAMKAALKEQKKELKAAIAKSALTEQERNEVRAKLQDIGDLKPEEISDLKLRKRIAEGEKDPEFAIKYIEPIKNAETEAMNLLVSLKLPEDISKWINEEGGLVQFYQSTKPVLDVDGKPVRNAQGRIQTQSEWFRTNILDNPALSPAQRDDIRDQVSQARQLHKTRDKALQELQAQGVEAEQKAENKRTERESAVKESYGKTVSELAEKLGSAAQLFEPKPDATPEQRATITRHNDRVKKGQQVVDHVMNEIVLSKDHDSPAFASKMAEIAIAAAQAEYLAQVNVEFQDTIDKLRTDLKAATDKIEKMKGARQTRTLESAPPPGQENKHQAPKGSDDEKAMDDLMSTVP